jgi:hypothetical protein
MREPAPDHAVFGLLAEFDRVEALAAAIRQARAMGFRRMDAFSPFPVGEVAEALDLRDNRVPWLALAGGLSGAALGIGMQVYANLAYPIDIGGRPLVTWQAFLLIGFELMVLGAVAFAVLGMLALNHLPRLHHPLFDVESFHLASDDKFFLVIFSDDRRFDARETRRFIEGLGPLRVDLVGQAEEAE